MKALVFNTAGDYKDVLRIEEVELPALTRSQVRIDVKARPVNPSDLYFIKGTYRRKPVFPQIAGLEGSGIVTQIGHDVRQVKPGDHVAFRWPGTWAEEIVVDESSLIKIDKPLPFKVSAQIGLNGITAYALLEQSQLKNGDYLLLDAASSALAALIIQLAAKKQVKIIATVRNMANANELLDLGAMFIFAQDDPELSGKIQQQIGAQKINCFIDTVGGDILSDAISLMAPSGIILICGNLSGGAQAHFTNPQISYGLLTIKGFGIDNWLNHQPPSTIREAYQNLINDASSGKLIFKPVTSIPMNELIYLNGHNQKFILITP